ncbi:CopC domain-containing protein YobA [Yokenella regensburgei]|uniref:CopC domain-containing protein YobA n=1 Tax=Yokenella regensburgei TaxID=158877 RepID=UPI003F189ED5
MVFTAAGTRHVLLLVSMLLTTPLAFAHAHLKTQIPAASSQATTNVKALTLNFSEGIEPAFSGLTLTDSKKQTIRTGKATHDKDNDTQLVVPLEQSLQPGVYNVDWHVVSVDGHKTRGTYSFTVK